jgi:uridine phosphorylase
MNILLRKTGFPFLDRALSPKDIGTYVLVPGSKSRVSKICDLLENNTEIFNDHEFQLITGKYKGVLISACSTGIGGTSVAIIINELIKLGANTFIRVGITGAIQKTISVGDVTLASAAIRRDRISDLYLPLAVPAIASFEIINALSEACKIHHFPFHIGITATSGTFYCGEGRHGPDGYYQSWMKNIVNDYQAAKVIDWDTETATLYSIAMINGVRAGRINGVVDSISSNKVNLEGEERAVIASLEAITLLNEKDNPSQG